MKTIIAAFTAVAFVTGGSAGCSSEQPPVKLKHGVLPVGAARLTIDGNDAGTTDSVHCAAVGSMTTIQTGDNSAGATIGLSNAQKLTVEFVRIRNLNGFSGDYNLGLEGDAVAALTQSTYHIAGTALGYAPGAIAPAAQQFAIEVTC